LWSILGGGTKMLAGANLWNSDQDIPIQRENLLKVFEGAWGDFLQKVPPQKQKSKTKEELLQSSPTKRNFMRRR
jgi:hypothetical protein